MENLPRKAEPRHHYKDLESDKLEKNDSATAQVSNRTAMMAAFIVVTNDTSGGGRPDGKILQNLLSNEVWNPDEELGTRTRHSASLPALFARTNLPSDARIWD